MRPRMAPWCKERLWYISRNCSKLRNKKRVFIVILWESKQIWKKKSFTFSFPTPVLPFILNFGTFSNSLATFLAIWSLYYILVSFTTLRRLRTMIRHISCIHGQSKLVELLTNPGCVMRTQPHSNYYFAHWYVWTLFKRNTATKRHRIIDH